MVRVLIDATALPANRGGVGRFVDELVTRLPSLGTDVHVAAQPRDPRKYATVIGRDQVHLAPAWANEPVPRLAWEQTSLPLLVRRIRPDVVHSPHYTMPLATSLSARGKHVVTLHDATFISLPERHLGVKAFCSLSGSGSRPAARTHSSCRVGRRWKRSSSTPASTQPA